MKRDRNERRAVMLSGADAVALEATAAMLERKNYKADAQRFRDLVARFDGAHGFTAVHGSLIEMKAPGGALVA